MYKTYWCIAQNLDECLYLADDIIPCEPHEIMWNMERDQKPYMFETEAEAWTAYIVSIRTMIERLNKMLLDAQLVGNNEI